MTSGRQYNDTWVIYVRDRDRLRAGIVDDFRDLKATLKFNDVGTWTMSVDRRSSKVIELTTPGYGIEVVNRTSGITLFSGPIDSREQSYDATTDTLALTGWDDNVLLKWRVSSPSPTESFPPYTVSAYDSRTGVASTVIAAYVNANLGPGAVSARREVGFTIGTDPVAGTTVSGKLRWTNLLEDIQKLAISGGNIGFRCLQGSTGIEFQTYQPVDLTQEVKFSVPLGNLVGGKIKSTSPEATYIYVGGGGELTARTIKEGSDGAYATWGRREVFEDRRDSTVEGELLQKITEVLAEKGEQVEFAVSVVDTDGLAFGRDYNLGDRVTAIFVGNEITIPARSPSHEVEPTSPEATPSVPFTSPILEGGSVQELIREVQLDMSQDHTNIIPVVGTPGKRDIFRLFREVRRIKQQLRNLEVR